MTTHQRQSLSDTMREAGVIPCELPELIPGTVARFRIEGDKPRLMAGLTRSLMARAVLLVAGKLA